MCKVGPAVEPTCKGYALPHSPLALISSKIGINSAKCSSAKYKWNHKICEKTENRAGVLNSFIQLPSSIINLSLVKIMFVEILGIYYWCVSANCVSTVEVI